MSGTDAVDGGFSFRMKKGFFVVMGTIALALGFLGLFLPVIPTTPLVLLAAACYMRGSERLHGRLLESKWFGETIRTYQAGQGLRKATKIRAISLMWIVITISAIFYVDSLPVRVVMFGTAILVTRYLLRLPTYDN
ncbi:MAG: YbaN family protein [Candidatus Bathyarchaeota archaeon]|nr:YbaN family protein [Candidatus Bathyarchaeota archaeon]